MMRRFFLLSLGALLMFLAALPVVRAQTIQAGPRIAIGQAIAGGTTGGVLYQTGSVLGQMTTTGSGTVLVLATSPTIVTPTIAKLANLTSNGFVTTSGGDGTLGVDTGTYVPTSRTVSTTSPLGGGGALSGNLTLTCTTCATSSNNLSFFAATTSAQLAGVLSDETGSGLAVFATSPTLTTPTLGAATATSINGNTFTTGTYTLTGASGKTLTFNNSLTLAGTDSTTMTFPSTSATIARTDAGNTFTGNQTINESAGGSGLTITGATQTSSFPALNVTQTWNASGTTFTLIKANATNTASASGSLLLDLQVGGSSQFVFNKSGQAAMTSLSTLGTGLFAASGQVQTSTLTWGAGFATLAGGSGNGNEVTVSTLNGNLVFKAGTTNIFEFRNSTSAQTLDLYNTYTSGTSFERLMLDWATTANVAMIYTQKGSGGGTARVLQINYGGTTTSAISVPITSGVITLGGGLTLAGTEDHAANYETFTEMTAPSAGGANTARIYAEDNGSGKTRLCAIFPSGAAQCFASEP